jgi:3-oxoacyl-[acyl-carrier-protein] synthase-3
MITTFHNKRISAVLTVLPSREIDFVDEMQNYGYSELKMQKLKKIMGYGTRRVAEPGDTVSDYAEYGIRHLFDNHVITPDEVGAIIVTTTSPDYFMPPVSNLIQGHLDLSKECVCIDISQACCGYSVGLCYAMMTLEHLTDKKVLLVSGDLMTFKVGQRDRASRPIIGDAVTVSIVENSDSDNTIYCSLKNEGQSAMSIVIPAGGTRMPITPETSVETQDEDGNWRSPEQFFMEGDLVFNFAINETPAMINELLKASGKQVSDIDYFICHQPNPFMLKKMAEKVGVPQERMPNDIVPKYGNSNSATIPVTLCEHYQEMYADKKSLTLCLASFGAGLSLGSFILEMPELDYCQFIVHKKIRN